jgi:hypothetical protein
MAKKAKTTAKKAPKNPVKKTAKKTAKAGAKKNGSKKTDGRSNPRSWSKDDVKQLKTLIKENTPTRLIAIKLKRTEAAVRYKVHSEGLSLRPTNRSPRD